MDSIANLAHRMGLSSRIMPYPSSAIGASVVQPLDLVATYTTFANLGTPVEPRFIYRIEDKNRKVVLTREVKALAPALDPRPAGSNPRAGTGGRRWRERRDPVVVAGYAELLLPA